LGTGWELILVVGGGLTVIIAAASYNLVERRCLMLKDRFSRSGASITHMPAPPRTAMALAQEETR
jgi:peptidoglycan/LPS O-acetylase OafA/YrhL